VILTKLYSYSNQLTSLDLSNNFILNDLDCSNNQLTNMILIQNTALTNLSCQNNLFTSLNVSQNVALTNLYCYNNLLPSLDVSTNTALTDLRCENNQLASLDVSANTSLIWLYCNNNLLTSLDVRNGNNINMTTFIATSNTSLNCISVDNVAYSTSNWTNIDSQAYYGTDCILTYVPDNNFEVYLEANGMGNGIENDDYVFTSNINSVTNLDVSFQSIADLTGIEDFIALETLFCSNNNLTSLDITQNTALTNLNCRSNQLTSLNLNQNTALTILRSDYNQLTSLDVSYNTALEMLYCNYNSLTNLNVSQNIGLTLLNCGNNQLTNLDVRNGNNTLITNFKTLNNPNLTCIEVDNEAYSTTNWTNIDATTSFSTNCSLSIEDFGLNNFYVYPNPTSSQITISNIQSSISSITIIDVMGKTVKNVVPINNTIIVSDLINGLYFMQIKTEKGIANTKFIKK